MTIGKYKYYFRKPKSEITKDVFSWLCIGGAIAIAATSPYFLQNVLRSHRKFKKYPKRKISSTFDQLRRQGFLLIQTRNKQIYISLTEKGRKRAGMFQINSLKIQKPKSWDKKWRLLIFDVAEKRKIVREALRGKLKEIGFQLFQESVWICPYDCEDEIALLNDFFGLSDKEVQLVIADKIASEAYWKKNFGI